MINDNEKWMKIAIHEAKIGENEGEVPVGAILVKNNQLIAKAHNKPISSNDVTAHAEILAIRNSGKSLQNYRLPGTTLYVTLEPCIMCLGAIIHARIDKLVFGALDIQNGIFGSQKNKNIVKKINHKIIVTGGVLEEECSNLLQSFFKERRKN